MAALWMVIFWSGHELLAALVAASTAEHAIEVTSAHTAGVGLECIGPEAADVGRPLNPAAGVVLFGRTRPPDTPPWPAAAEQPAQRFRRVLGALAGLNLDVGTIDPRLGALTELDDALDRAGLQLAPGELEQTIRTARGRATPAWAQRRRRRAPEGAFRVVPLAERRAS